MSRKAITPGLLTTLQGRCFVHPLLDYLLIGGGLSLLVTLVVVMNRQQPNLFDAGTLAWIVLFSNGAHFAASTVRLYTKPGAAASMPFLSKIVPPVIIILMTLCLVYAGRVGGLLDTLYLTWSPYHYAAQAYGLAVMYSYRSGCNLEATDKKLLRWVCMIPFFYMAARMLGSRLPVPIGDLVPAIAPAECVLVGHGVPWDSVSGDRHHLRRQGSNGAAREYAWQASPHALVLRDVPGARLGLVHPPAEGLCGDGLRFLRRQVSFCRGDQHSPLHRGRLYLATGEGRHEPQDRRGRLLSRPRPHRAPRRSRC